MRETGEKGGRQKEERRLGRESDRRGEVRDGGNEKMCEKVEMDRK